MPIDNDFTPALEAARSRRERANILANRLAESDHVVMYDERGADTPISDDDLDFIIKTLKGVR